MLQSTKVDLTKAVELAETLQQTLREYRSESSFETVWGEILNICESNSIPVTLPQRTPTFSWQSGRKRLWQAALNDHYTILDICMISGAFGHTINRIFWSLRRFSIIIMNPLNLNTYWMEQKIDFLDTTLYKGPAFNQTGKLDIDRKSVV